MSYTQPNTADTANVFHLNSGQRIAVIVTGIIGTISTTSVALLLIHLFTVSFVSGRVNANKDERIFLRMHLGAFVVCLLCSDLIQGISGIMQLEWARTRQIRHGPLCTAQAAMLLFGDNGTAFWNAVVAIHTFWTVVLRKRMSTVAVAFLIATGWTMCVILTVIGPVAIQTPERGPFYSIAGAWCFVTTEYKDSRIYLHYLPMLLSGFIITVLYLLVALVLFGILVVDGKRWRLKAPRTTGIRELIGQFSWGRIGRGNTTGGQTQSTHSSGIKSLGGRIHTGSIRLASVGRKSSEVKRTDDFAGVATVQTIDIAPPRPRPESDSTMSSPLNSPGLGGFERGRSADSKSLREKKSIGLSKEGKIDVKVPVAAAPTTQSATVSQVTGKGVPLKQLAIKMLWYPIVYLILVMPIAVSRVDSSLNVSLSVMLGFMCLLWSMGTANTIIYVCTRRLGPNPWSRRQLSLSRSRSKGTRKKDPSPPTGAVQIRVDQFTQHATDEQFIVPREKSSNRNSLTGAEISILDPNSSTPSPPPHKVGFEFDTQQPPTTHHVLQHQQSIRSSRTALSPTSPLRQQYEEPHPYSQAQSPRAHEPRNLYPQYYIEDDDDSLRTQSRTHSRGGSLSNNGRPMAF